jgi:hypothetical protein
MRTILAAAKALRRSTMKTNIRFALPFLVMLVAGCTSMRVTGNITDSVTGDVVPNCGVTIGPRYISADGAGHFVVNARKSWGKLDVVCAGYEPQSVEVDSSQSRYPTISILMTPRRSAKAPRGSKEALVARGDGSVADAVYSAPPSITEPQAKK